MSQNIIKSDICNNCTSEVFKQLRWLQVFHFDVWNATDFDKRFE